MENSQNTQSQGFNGLGISQDFLVQLTKLNFTVPTPIQHKAIPVAIQGKDVVGIAQTGTGKTLAFGIPMVQNIAATKGQKMGLVILPTRELAIQVNETLQKITRGFGMRTAVLIGGESMYHQLQALRNSPHVVIGTPGRINDLVKQGKLQLGAVSILVLDEADNMFDMGFAPQIKQILLSVPKERQTMLFSATMPDSILKIASQNMKLPLRIEIAPQGTAAELVEHEMFMVKKEQRMALLQKLLGEYKGTVLVFSRTKHGAKKITHALQNAKFTADEIHSNRSLGQRKKALEGFKTGKHRVLVATDIASRGIDVKGIELVVNYDLPEAAEDYVHRIGRTGRAGLTGKAISFAAPDQRNKVRDIERLIRTKIPVSHPEGLPYVAPVTTKMDYNHSQNKFSHSNYQGKKGYQGKKNYHGKKTYSKKY